MSPHLGMAAVMYTHSSMIYAITFWIGLHLMNFYIHSGRWNGSSHTFTTCRRCKPSRGLCNWCHFSLDGTSIRPIGVKCHGLHHRWSGPTLAGGIQYFSAQNDRLTFGTVANRKLLCCQAKLLKMCGLCCGVKYTAVLADHIQEAYSSRTCKFFSFMFSVSLKSI